jgi:hypothetical protein
MVRVALKSSSDGRYCKWLALNQLRKISLSYPFLATPIILLAFRSVGVILCGSHVAVHSKPCLVFSLFNDFLMARILLFNSERP